MADVMGASLYKLVNAMAGNEVTAQEIADATANKTFGDVANDLTEDIKSGDLPIGGGGVKANFTVTLNPLQPTQSEVSCDKTFQEIKEAAIAGNLSASLTTFYNGQPMGMFPVLFPDISFSEDGAAHFLAFSVANSGMLTVYDLQVLTDNTIVFDAFELDSQA